MIVVHSIDDVPPSMQNQSSAFAIGFFDGIHPGHLSLFQAMREVSNTLAVCTFKNHPLNFLRKQDLVIPIMHPEMRLRALEEAGIDLTIFLDFDDKIASIEYDDFIKKIRTRLPFKHIFEGKGDCFGKDRRGNEENVSKLGNTEGFTAHYLQKKEGFSSTAIRKALSDGKFAKALKLLGHPFLFFGSHPPSHKLLAPGEYLAREETSKEKNHLLVYTESGLLENNLEKTKIYELYSTHDPRPQELF